MNDVEIAVREAFLIVARTGAASVEPAAARLTLADPDVDVAGVAAALLRDQVALQYERGWQPADLVHVVRREGSQRITRLLTDVIMAEAIAARAVDRAPEEWVAQLKAMTGRRTTTPATVHRWRVRERLGALDAWRDVFRLADDLARWHPLEVLIPPPSRWDTGHRAGSAPRGPGSDERVLGRIRALLAKAESTDFPEEAEALAAKAQELMTRHAIDAALLAEARGGRPRAGVRARRVHLDDPYARQKLSLLTAVGEANGVQAVWSEKAGIATIVGDPDDLSAVELLFLSLLVQSTRALTATGRAEDRRNRSPAFRRAFLAAYAQRIGERLRAARDSAAAEAGRASGRDLVPVLAARDRAVADAVTELFPRVRAAHSRVSDTRGWYAGRAAAESADLGGPRRREVR